MTKIKNNLGPNWREHYDEINWPHSEEGFTRTGANKIIKRYGIAAATEKHPA